MSRRRRSFRLETVARWVRDSKASTGALSADGAVRAGPSGVLERRRQNERLAASLTLRQLFCASYYFWLQCYFMERQNPMMILVTNATTLIPDSVNQVSATETCAVTTPAVLRESTGTNLQYTQILESDIATHIRNLRDEPQSICVRNV